VARPHDRADELGVTVRLVTKRSLARRGSWLPADFIYEPGRRVQIGSRPAVVLRQHDDVVVVSYLELVPGSRVVFSCSVPCPVGIYLIALTRTKEK
jgi:hypothetical protein